MFENLKAFIRHGKGANDLRKKRLVDEESTMSYVGDGLNNFPAPSFGDIGDGTAPVDGTVAAELPSVADDGTDRSRVTHQTQRLNHRDYEQVASQIVQQERLDKESKPYENLEHYEVLEQMGEGAFSIVYKARHFVSNKLVAIKILRKFQMDQSQKQAVLKEVTIMRQLNHPNIVRFVEFIDSTNYYYIVQELASGGEIFASIVKYTYFSEDLSRHVIVQLGSAIRYLHEEIGIVHRDIKPENLLFNPIEFNPSATPLAKLRKSDDPNTKQDEGEFTPGVGGGGIGVVKLADFGLSKQIWEHNTKTPCGTVGYAAPEIVKDEHYSKEVDMWAIGCVLYTLLCGFPPFYDERIESLTAKVAKGEFTFLSPWWDEISAEAKHCVLKLLTVNPRDRYTIDEFLNDPWIRMTVVPESAPLRVSNSAKTRAQHPIQQFNKQQNYNSGLYSPAAVALRDAFDISTAVHRMGEEAALSHKHNAFDVLAEEDEEIEQTDALGHVVPSSHRTQKRKPVEQKTFDLNLKGASILERRLHKNVSVKS